jgi:hypothetical protein
MTTLEPIPKINTYERFQEQEGIPVVTGFFVEDVATAEVKPWARIGRPRSVHHSRWHHTPTLIGGLNEHGTT